MLGPDYQRPELEVPETYRQAIDEGESLANLPWWTLFRDPKLVELVQVALENNRDLLIAAARVEEYRALLGVSESRLWPEVNAAASAGRARNSRNSLPGGLLGDPVDQYRVGAEVFFEVDLFGRLRRSNEAARAQLLATEEARVALTISLVASVAEAYMRLRDLDQRFEISGRTRNARAESLEIISARYDKGTVPLLDVNQAEIELAVAEGSVSAAERAMIQTENALSILLGQNPGPIERGVALSDQVLPPSVPAGLPSELLQRRPDVRVAEAELAAQTARIGVAEAARWPSLSLTGALGLESSELSGLSNSGSEYWGVGAGLFAPLFNAGRNARQVEAEEARTEQLMQAYLQTVQSAFKEVEDSLVAVRTYRTEYDARERQVTAARSAAMLSRARYDGGVTSYLEVLDTERSLFGSELAQSEALASYTIAIIRLYKALGGGWSPVDGD